MEESESRGRNEGIQIGADNKARDMAIKLLRRNYPVNDIVEDTGLSYDVIMSLKSQG
jgi:hypothetical protein